MAAWRSKVDPARMVPPVLLGPRCSSGVFILGPGDPVKNQTCRLVNRKKRIPKIHQWRNLYLEGPRFGSMDMRSAICVGFPWVSSGTACTSFHMKHRLKHHGCSFPFGDQCQLPPTRWFGLVVWKVGDTFPICSKWNWGSNPKIKRCLIPTPASTVHDFNFPTKENHRNCRDRKRAPSSIWAQKPKFAS